LLALLRRKPGGIERIGNVLAEIRDRLPDIRRIDVLVSHLQNCSGALNYRL